jgi:uncharacterized protein involved in response to NO
LTDRNDIGHAAPAVKRAGRVSRRIAPFFFLAALDALTNMAVWLAVYFHPGFWPDRPPSPIYWHAHEMLFGFVAAAIGGFLLTAVPGWTGRAAGSPASRMPLMGLWLAGRVAMAPFVAIPLPVASFADLIFLPALGLALVPGLIRARKFRNLSLIGPLAGLFLANLLFHLGMNGALNAGEHIGLAISIDIISILVVVVSGRLIPAFTRSGLNGRNIDAIAKDARWIDAAAIAAAIVVLLADIAMPLSAFSGAVAFFAGLAQILRIMRWLVRSGTRNAFISMFHVAYVWLTVGFLLKGIWLLTAASVADKWIHAFTAGAFGTMILAVMTRTSPAPAVRNGVWNPAIPFSLITLAATVRVLAPPFLPGAYNAIIAISGALWIAAFGVFLGSRIMAPAGSRL